MLYIVVVRPVSVLKLTGNKYRPAFGEETGNKFSRLTPAYDIEEIGLRLFALAGESAVHGNAEAGYRNTVRSGFELGISDKVPDKYYSVERHDFYLTYEWWYALLFASYDERTKNAVGDVIDSVKLGGEFGFRRKFDENIITFGKIFDGVREFSVAPLIESFNGSVGFNERNKLAHNALNGFFAEGGVDNENSFVLVFLLHHFTPPSGL